MSRVIVLGGGVGGLSAAHELARRDFIDVDVYERSTVWGGKARSTELPGTGTGGRPDLPAEHGFRFFPGFYRHLSEILAEIPRQGGVGTVLDNLVAANQIAIAQEAEEPWRFMADAPDTLEEWVQALVTLYDADALHLSVGDVALFVSKVFCILGSCEQRRREQYDTIPWWTFVEAEARSDAYRKILARGLTLSLVAMRATQASTYTIGNVLIQLLIDILSDDRDADRVLNGPTNVVWMDHWTAHLAASGRVTLHADTEITQLNFDGVRISSVTIDRGGALSDVGTSDDYYVCALPVEAVQSLLSDPIKAAAGMTGIDNLETAWMNGVLFYLNRDISMTHGHALYVDSPWALTSISQRQFWDVKPDQYGNGEVVDILSSIISEWDTPGNQVVGKKAWATDDQAELMLEAWAQLKAHRMEAGTGALEDADRVPAYVDEYVDEAIDWVAPGNLTNREPLLINTTDSWVKRPQATTEISNLMLASDYVQTETNLATMEGAAEAGRAAVNGVLRAEGRADLCPIYPFEEPACLDPFKAVDQINYSIDPDSKPAICVTVDAILEGLGFPVPPTGSAGSGSAGTGSGLWLIVIAAIVLLLLLLLLWIL